MTTLTNQFVVIAVDTAAQSGWCIRVVGQDCDPSAANAWSGVCLAMDLTAVQEVIRRAINVAEDVGITREKVVLVKEAPFGGKPHTLFGLGRAHGVWDAVWRSMGCSDRRRLSVKPREWRKAELGRDRGNLHPSEQARAKVISGYPPGAPDFPQDQAAAICIASWASRAPRVSARIPTRISRKRKAA